jgi:hypothetical protein
MGSNQKETRLRQKEEYQQMIKKRRSLLTEKGIENDDIKKDKVLKHFQAELRRTQKAIQSIDAREKVVARAAEKSRQHAEEKKQPGAKKKGKQKQEAAKQESGKKKKKKDKKADKQ